MLEAQMNDKLRHELNSIIWGFFPIGEMEWNMMDYCLTKIVEKDLKTKDQFLHFFLTDHSSYKDTKYLNKYAGKVFMRSVAMIADFIDTTIEETVPSKDKVHEKLVDIGTDSVGLQRDVDRISYSVKYAKLLAKKHPDFREAFHGKLSIYDEENNQRFN